MIFKEEIQQVATHKQVGVDIVEKDYTLGWVLAGIHHHPATKESWVFKGGTCLKKCYLETFRFSEDLDFTYTGKSQLHCEALYKNIFIEIAHWIYDNSGIELPEEGIEFELFQNKRNSISVQGKLSYRGPSRRNINVIRLPRIKLDLTLDEPLVLKPVIKKFEHSYSDMQEVEKNIFAYAFEELFAEKMRALVQRLRPRDLYDVIHIFQNQNLTQNPMLLRQTLEKKFLIRAVPLPTLELIENHDNRKLLESEWEMQLRHQLPVLPPLENFLRELENFFDWIVGKYD